MNEWMNEFLSHWQLDMTESTENVIVQGRNTPIKHAKNWIVNSGIYELYYKLEIFLILI